jgi:hypothetical protein
MNPARSAISAWRGTSGALGTALDTADGLVEPLRAAARGLYRSGRRLPDTVREAPLTALALAVAAGALATFLFVRRNRR